MEECVALEKRWVSVPDMPRSVSGAAAVALDGRLLVIGGEDSDFGGGCDDDYHDFFPAVLEYNPGDRSWKELPSLLTARSYCAAPVLGGDVVVLGGLGFDGDLESVERYDRRSQCWEAMPSLPTGMIDPYAMVVRV